MACADGAVKASSETVEQVGEAVRPVSRVRCTRMLGGWRGLILNGVYQALERLEQVPLDRATDDTILNPESSQRTAKRRRIDLEIGEREARRFLVGILEGNKILVENSLQ
jgi:hypothetical protein